MKIAVAQIDCDLGNIRANCDTIIRMIEKAATQNADMIVLPEMSDTGYEIATISRYASLWSKKESPFRHICEAAKKSHIRVVCGLSRRDNDSTIYNSALIVDQYGHYIGHYDKSHLFDFSSTQESSVITAGDHFLFVNIDGIIFGFLICYDLRFPEVARTLALEGAEVIIIIAAFPLPREEHWKILTKSRAIENQVYVVAANRIGTDGNLTFCGNSCIIDPSGVYCRCLNRHSEELFCEIIDSEKVSSIQKAMDVFGQRRPDLYYKE